MANRSRYERDREDYGDRERARRPRGRWDVDERTYGVDRGFEDVGLAGRRDVDWTEPGGFTTNRFIGDYESRYATDRDYDVHHGDEYRDIETEYRGGRDYDRDLEREGGTSDRYGRSGDYGTDYYTTPDDYRSGGGRARWEGGDFYGRAYEGRRPGRGGREGGGERLTRPGRGYERERGESWGQGASGGADAWEQTGNYSGGQGFDARTTWGYGSNYGTTALGSENYYGSPDYESGRARGADTERWGMTGPYTGRGPQNYRRSDDRIREDVCERLTENDWLDASEVEVEVENGEVTLRGTVDDRRSKRLADDLAESVSGVNEVHNELRVSRSGRPETTGRATAEQQTRQGGRAKSAEGKGGTAEKQKSEKRTQERSP